MARVLDRHGRRVPAGAVGELHLGGPCIADGYDRHEADPGQPGPFSVREDEGGRASRWYATGDLARWREDGRLDYLGRRDRQVKLRGQRVELGEIEATIRRLPGVREAAVEILGSGGGRRLAVFVAPEMHGVRESLSAALPAAWIPDLVITWPDLPRLPSGKLDRAVLRNHSSTTGPGPAADRVTDGHGPETGLERTVLSIVRALLEDDAVGLDDDFFAVGGNSLLAARLMGQLSVMLGVAVPLHELLGDSTVRGIAALADRDFSRGTAASREEARVVPVRERGSLPPAVLIARDGATSLVLKHFLSRMGSDRPLLVVLRPMPALGYRVPDLVADGAAVAQLLLDHFPDGPVHLLGHSASGIVTVETARALGDRRGVTILLDTVPPSAWSATRLRVLANLARRALERGRLRKAGIRPPRDADAPATPKTARAFRLYQDSLASSETRMRPLDFPLTVITSEATRTALGRSDLGWGRWATRLATVPLEGDHLSLLLQPEVAETARVIDEVLGRWR
jgi:nonribosomal peptide synthetase DhbF